MKKLIFIVFCILMVSCAYAYIERSEYKCGIIDLTGKEIIQPKAGVYFETIGDSFCLTDKDGDKYGYCDITGKQITPIESDWPCYPINNLVAVNKNQKIGVYDLKGKLVFPFKYDITTWGTVTSYAPLKYNNVLCSYDDEVWALLNINGKKILPFEYEFIRGDCTQDLDIYLKAFKNDKVGYYNLDGSVIIPCEYDEIGEFHNKVASCKKGNKWCVKNLKGETLYGPTDKYDAIYPLNTNVYICKKNNIYSLVKDRKEIISGVKYCNIEELCKEKEFVDYICLKDNDKQYVLDSDGNILFTCLKDYIIKEKKQILYENKYNMIVFGVREKSQYTENSFYGEDINSEIFANLEEFDNAIKSKIYNYGVVINALYPYFIYTEGKDVETYKFFKTEDEAKKYAIENNLTYKNVQRPIYYGIMDKSGKIVLEPDYVNISEVNEEYVSVLNKDSKHGVVDIKGNVVVDFKYPSQIHYLGNGMFSYGIQNRYEEKINDEYIDVKFEDKAFVIDKTGKVLVECESTYGLFDNGPIVIKKDSKYQLYDLNLNPISKEYDFLDHNAYYDFPFNFIYLYGKEFKKTKYVVVYNKL